MVQPEPVPTGDYYEIKIQGALDEQWSSWFNGSTISSSDEKGDVPVTTLTVYVPDQAKLRGLLNKIWDLHLTVLSITRKNSQVQRMEKPHG